MATYVNDLRLKEIATGDEAGTWGTSTNTNLELIAEAFSFGTEAITTNADAHTTTIADGSTDPGRSIFLKYTGALDSDCTITIGPNTVSKLWFIENATTDSGSSGPYNIIIKQGTGATVTVPNSHVKAIYSDGAGSGGAMVEALTDLNLTDSLTISGSTPTLTIGDAGAEDTKLVFDGNAKDFYVGLDDSADKLVIGEGSSVGTNSIVTLTDDSVTIGDGAEVDTKIVFDGNAQDFYIGLDDSADDLVIGKGSAVGTTPAIEIDENLDIKFAESIGVGQAASSTTGDIVAQTMSLKGTTPTLTIGDAGAEDTKIVFDGNAQDFYIGLDDSADDLVIGVGSAVGTTPAIIVNESQQVGIGVAPTHAFNLETTGAGEARFRSSDNDMSLQISSDADETHDSILEFTSGTSGRGRIVYDHNTTAASQKMNFVVGDVATTALTIDGSGNIGAGTTSPDVRLQVSVAGDATLKVTNSSASKNASIIVGGSGARLRSDDALIFDTGSSPSERMRIHSGGDLSIGTTSTFSGPLTTSRSGGSAGSSNNQIAFTHTGASNAYHIKSIRASGDDEVAGLAFVENTTERMRINAGGEVCINNTFSGAKLHVLNSGGDTSNWCQRYYTTHTSNPNYIVDFIDHEGQRMGSIQGNPSANTLTYSTSSDYRLKENVSYDWDATTRLKQLKPARFNWIRDESNTLVDGFLAHEVEDIVPIAMSGEKDATETKTNVVLNSYGNWIVDNITEEEWEAGKEDGTYDADTTWTASHTQNLYQGIDQAKLIPLLVKTIQELEARITTLESA